MKDDPVSIVKDGRLLITDEGHLSKGDLVFIQAGDVVPADLQLVEADGLEIDEFDLTGEILPVTREADSPDGYLYRGSRILRGVARGRVLAVGDQTEFGKILKQSWETTQPQELPALQRRSWRLVGWFVPAFLFLLTQGMYSLAWAGLFLTACLALVDLPLQRLVRRLLASLELRRLARRQIQIRDSSALERLNQVDLLCLDKTGVLTTRSMQVKDICFADGAHGLPAAQSVPDVSTLVNLACALCNQVLYLEKLELAHPIDQALIAYARDQGLDLPRLHTQYARVYDQPFDSENRYMAVGFEREDHAVFYFAKGDPGVILDQCTHYLTATGEQRKVDLPFFDHTAAQIERINLDGDAVIALAWSPCLPQLQPAGLTFLCLLQLENLIRPAAAELIHAISQRKIRSVLLTGDRAETAGRVGAAVGITDNPRIYLSGRTLERMGLNEVARQSTYCSIFARLLPSQKAVLIRLFQQQGHTIAMLGDGPNDVLALKAADIGVSFVQHSSPIARQLSKILVNDLTDLLDLLRASDRLHRRIEIFKVMRFLALVGLWLGVYAWMVFLYWR